MNRRKENVSDFQKALYQHNVGHRYILNNFHLQLRPALAVVQSRIFFGLYAAMDSTSVNQIVVTASLQFSKLNYCCCHGQPQ